MFIFVSCVADTFLNQHNPPCKIILAPQETKCDKGSRTAEGAHSHDKTKLDPRHYPAAIARDAGHHAWADCRKNWPCQEHGHKARSRDPRRVGGKAMKMTSTRHTVLARLSHGDWQSGHDLAAPTVLSSLHLAGLIRDDMSGGAMQDRMWVLTPAGFRALEEAGE
jgi:hypothetical protein